ncbi:hypothetical protein BKA70DRAFT_1466621 [Coprinopsis sp. MPI-PUGE-AT-0042]|nr:hypothetical protein BKA70DRAFT_1466621 [Coprinopsis sp. MPI-PUGE-AT-0042]
MSTCSDDCICCCLPCVVCWACVYYSYVGVTRSCRWCYRKCRGLEDEDDEDTNRRPRRGPSAAHHSLHSSAGPSSPRQTIQDMESIGKGPVSLKVPAPAYPHSSIRTQPQPVEEMILTLPSGSSPSASSSSRGGTPQSNPYSYSERCRPHNRSSRVSTSFPADLVSQASRPTASLHDRPEISPSLQHKKHVVPLMEGGEEDISDAKGPISLEHRGPHEAREALRKYGPPPPS